MTIFSKLSAHTTQESDLLRRTKWRRPMPSATRGAHKPWLEPASAASPSGTPDAKKNAVHLSMYEIILCFRGQKVISSFFKLRASNGEIQKYKVLIVNRRCFRLPFQQQLLILLYSTKHRLRAQPVKCLEPITRLSARHARAPRTIVVVCVPECPPSNARHILTVFLVRLLL